MQVLSAPRMGRSLRAAPLGERRSRSLRHGLASMTIQLMSLFLQRGRIANDLDRFRPNLSRYAFFILTGRMPFEVNDNRALLAHTPVVSPMPFVSSAFCTS